VELPPAGVLMVGTGSTKLPAGFVIGATAKADVEHEAIAAAIKAIFKTLIFALLFQHGALCERRCRFFLVCTKCRSDLMLRAEQKADACQSSLPLYVDLKLVAIKPQ
jgi:hypothetical protein